MAVRLRRVLISDAVDQKCADLLQEHGVHVTTKYKLSKEDLIEELKNHDGLIVRSETKVTAEVIKEVPNLKVIGRAGSGVDTIDVDAATKQGIVVLNTPGGNSISACELTCALISALARNVVQGGASLKEKRWDRKLYAGYELYGKTLGIIGFGNIGRLVARRMQSFGMKIFAYDPFLTSKIAQEYDVTEAQLTDIWAHSDYITVHTPLIPQTKNLINADTLAKCKKGVRIINLARGGIVDELALLNSIKSNHCGGAAIDVFVDEPPKDAVTWELIQHPKVIGTPHLGASTAEAQQRVAVEIAEQFLAISGKSSKYAITGIVNAPALAATISPENGPWVELCKKLGEIASRFLEVKPSAKIECFTVGESLKSKSFIHVAVVLGLLSRNNRNYANLNLVNAISYGTSAGLNVKQISTDKEGFEPGVYVNIGQHCIKGTVRGKNEVLLGIDDTNFENGIYITGFISLYRITSPQDLVKVVSAFADLSNSPIHSVQVGKNWIVVQTEDSVNVQVDGVQTY